MNSDALAKAVFLRSLGSNGEYQNVNNKQERCSNTTSALADYELTNSPFVPTVGVYFLLFDPPSLPLDSPSSYWLLLWLIRLILPLSIDSFEPEHRRL
jgi:hypothetical protein